MKNLGKALVGTAALAVVMVASFASASDNNGDQSAQQVSNASSGSYGTLGTDRGGKAPPPGNEVESAFLDWLRGLMER